MQIAKSRDDLLGSSDLRVDCRSIRRRVAAALYASGGGHYGGSLSVVEILAVLCRDFVFTRERGDDTRDKLILSKGHAAIALYATLAQLGRLEPSLLLRYGTLQSGLEGHPDMLLTRDIDFSTGSLGQGLSVGIGMALALRASARRVWVVLGDGECQEGQVWEAAILAARHGLTNLTAIVDANGSQDFGFAQNPDLPQSPLPEIPSIWSAFGWHVAEVDGHDVNALHGALSAAKSNLSKPSVVVANTRKGAGVELFERMPTEFHCTRLTSDQHRRVMKELA